eukprot:s4606_g2.t1
MELLTGSPTKVPRADVPAGLDVSNYEQFKETLALRDMPNRTIDSMSPAPHSRACRRTCRWHRRRTRATRAWGTTSRGAFLLLARKPTTARIDRFPPWSSMRLPIIGNDTFLAP